MKRETAVRDRIQELEEAKVGIDIMIQFEKLMQASRKNPMYDDTSTSLRVTTR